MPNFYKFSFSNLLILIWVLFTITWYLNPSFISEWSINNKFLLEQNYFHWFIQFFTWTFIHSWILHLLMNSIFIYYFWNILEVMIWKTKFIIFFILFVIFNWVALNFLDPNASTVWISWFVLAIITYYILDLKRLRNPEYKWWITAIVISIWVWFFPWVSLFGHINWVIFWIIFFYLTHDFFKKQLVWLFNYFKSNKKVEKLWTLNTKKD